MRLNLTILAPFTRCNPGCQITRADGDFVGLEREKIDD